MWLISRSQRLLSPIELLLPNGFAVGSITLGSACPSSLAPAPREETSPGAPIDLAVLAPGREERADPAWTDHAVHTVTARLSPSGLVYVIPARARRLRRALAAAGLRDAGTLLQIPDLAHTRHVVPLGTAAARYALSGRLPMNRLKRQVAAAAFHHRSLRTLGPTGALLRRDPPAPLAAWLFDVEGSRRPPGSTLVTAGDTSPSGGSVLHRFAGTERVPDAVAKVSRKAVDELEGLGTIAPGAARAGVRVPRILGSGTLGPAPYVLQSAVAGFNAGVLIERRRLDPGSLQTQVAAWLESWGRAAARPRELTRQDLERFILSPATTLAGEHGSYVEYLRELCADAEGTISPFTPSHGDLTTANIVVGEESALGIVDWEEAREESLPLMDFFYMAADAVAATSGYTNRPEAFAACFERGGAHVAPVAGMRRTLARALDIDPVVEELCFHACWLHHGENEGARSCPSTGPFITIVRSIASDARRFRHSEQGR